MNLSLTPSLAWIVLIAAGALEIVWSLSMKASDGFTRASYTAINEPASASRIACIALIVLGIVGLKLTGGH